MRALRCAVRLVVEATMFATMALVGLVGGHALWWLVRWAL